MDEKVKKKKKKKGFKKNHYHVKVANVQGDCGVLFSFMSVVLSQEQSCLPFQGTLDNVQRNF